jgi:hypothetical protein
MASAFLAVLFHVCFKYIRTVLGQSLKLYGLDNWDWIPGSIRNCCMYHCQFKVMLGLFERVSGGLSLEVKQLEGKGG